MFTVSPGLWWEHNRAEHMCMKTDFLMHSFWFYLGGNTPGVGSMVPHGWQTLYGDGTY